jgi:hypothetical protein
MAIIVHCISEELYLSLLRDGHIPSAKDLKRTAKINDVCNANPDNKKYLKDVLTKLPTCIDWKSDGQIVYNDKIIENSSISDLALSLCKPPSSDLVWMKEFWEILREEKCIDGNIDLKKLCPKYTWQVFEDNFSVPDTH